MAINPIASGIQAFLGATQRVQDSATQIAQNSINGSSSDLVAPLVELKVAEQQAQAAAKVIEVEKNQIGTLLDVLS